MSEGDATSTSFLAEAAGWDFAAKTGMDWLIGHLVASIIFGYGTASILLCDSGWQQVTTDVAGGLFGWLMAEMKTQLILKNLAGETGKEQTNTGLLIKSSLRNVHLCGEPSEVVSTIDEAEVTTPNPKFDPKIAERLDNAVAICDASFAMHEGFLKFATAYMSRPHNTYLCIPSGVRDDILRLGRLDEDRRMKSTVLAEAIIQVLTEWGYAESNGMYSDEHISTHVQILKVTDYLRTNHRICVLSNSTRLIQDVQHLRKDRRKQAKGISCIRLSDKTLKPMVARWYDPTTYATSYVGR